GQGILGVKADGFIVVLDGLGVVFLVGVGNAPVIEGPSKLGVKADRFIVVLDGLGVVFLVGVGPAPVIEGPGKLGVEADRSGEVFDRRIIVVAVERSGAAAEVGGREPVVRFEVAIQPHRLAIVL